MQELKTPALDPPPSVLLPRRPFPPACGPARAPLVSPAQARYAGPAAAIASPAIDHRRIDPLPPRIFPLPEAASTTLLQKVRENATRRTVSSLPPAERSTADSKLSG